MNDKMKEKIEEYKKTRDQYVTMYKNLQKEYRTSKLSSGGQRAIIEEMNYAIAEAKYWDKIIRLCNTTFSKTQKRNAGRIRIFFNGRGRTIYIGSLQYLTKEEINRLVIAVKAACIGVNPNFLNDPDLHTDFILVDRIKVKDWNLWVEKKEEELKAVMLHPKNRKETKSSKNNSSKA